MKTSTRTALGALALLACGLAQAGQPISLLTPVTYEYETSVLHKTKETCKLEDKLAGDLGGEILKRAGRPATTTATTGVVLRVMITGSGGIGGGGWTGSKSLSVKAQQLRDGQVVRSRSFTRKSRGGLAGPFEGTCGILEGISETLAKDIVDWSGTETDAAFDADAARSAAAEAASSPVAEAAASAVQ
jgi:hypothetical protein